MLRTFFSIACIAALSAGSPEFMFQRFPKQDHDHDALHPSALKTLNDNLPQLAEHLGETQLVSWLKRARLDKTLANSGPFTLFGPTDKAIKALPKKFGRALVGNRTALAEVLKYHTINGSIPLSQLSNELLVPTLNGKDIRINIYGQVITASGAEVELADQSAVNGMLHEVTKVMLPPVGTAAEALGMCPKMATLKRALNVAQLESVLNGPGPVTVFAPTNEAFAKLPADVLDILLNNQSMLADVLTNHVVAGTYYSAGLSDGMSLTTLAGHPVEIHLTSDDVLVNDAMVVYKDATVDNGCVYAIDKVLFPPNLHYSLVYTRR